MHNRRIPTLLLILIFTLALLSPVCAEKVQAKASLGVKSFRITKGNSRRLYVKGSKKKVKWKTSNKAVAVVNKTGLVTAKKGGTATITAKVGKKKLKCKVKVRGLNRNRITMHRNLKYKLKVMNGAAGSSWKSSNSRIAKVSSDGMVTAKASGKCFISCVSGGKKLSCEINVAKLNKSVINLGQGGSSELVRTGSITACKWSSSNNTVASVNKYGDVYGVAGGTAVVTCSCGSAKLKCTVYVKGNNIVTARSSLKASKSSRQTVTVNGAYGKVNYTIYNQASSINKSTVSKRKKFMPYHGCAASATSAVLGGMLGIQVTPVQMIESVEPMVFGKTSWKKNYKKSYKNQLPLSLNGITKIFTYYGIETKYVRTFTDSGARNEIARHLKSGQPVLFVVSKKNRATGKSSSKWTNSYHTMAMLGITDTGKVMVADSVNRSSFGSWQRIKLVGINEVIHYMFSCKKVKNTNYWGGASSSGGYVLVYTKKNEVPEETPDEEEIIEDQPTDNPEEDPNYIPPTDDTTGNGDTTGNSDTTENGYTTENGDTTSGTSGDGTVTP